MGVKLSTSYKIVRIKWLDHSGWENNTWHDFDSTVSDLAPFAVDTVGFLLNETDQYYVVAGTLANDNEKTNGEFLILKGTVLSVEVLVDI